MSKSIILYATRHGCTQQAAEILKQQLQGEVSLVNVNKEKIPDLAPFNLVVLAGSIHIGRVQKKIRDIGRKLESIFLEKTLGLYLCCMEKGDNAQKQFNDAFPELLRQHAAAKGLFGGGFNFDKMNFIERFMIKKAAKVTESINTLNEDAIKEFANYLNQATP